MPFLSRINMKTQLFIYSGLLLLLVSVTSYLTGYFGGQFTITDFLSQSQIIYEKVNYDDLTTSKNYLRYLSTYFEISKIYIKQQDSRPMKILNELYLKYKQKINLDQNYLNSNNFGGKYPIPNVIANINNSVVSDSLFCYAFKNYFNQSDENHAEQVAFGDFVAPLGHIFSAHLDQNQPLLYGYITDSPNLLYSYPCYQYGEKFDDYIPESRPWFQLAKQISNETLNNLNYSYNVTAPYFFNQAKQIGITLVMPLITQELQFTGTWCVDIFPEYLISITQKMTSEIAQTRIMIVTKDGIVIKENTNDEVFPIYFYNKSQTGFDERDWEKVQSNKIFIFKAIDHQKQIQQLIKKFYLEQQQLYILFIIDYTTYSNYQLEQKHKMQEEITNLLNQNLILILISFIALQILVFLTISYIIMRPIENIINYFRIKNNKTLKEKYENLLNDRFKYRNHFYISPSIQNLQQTIYKLYQGIFRRKKIKDPQCEIMQKFQFPKRERFAKIRLNNEILIDLNIQNKKLVLKEFQQLVRFDMTI